jgi:hypothetical protein
MQSKKQNGIIQTLHNSLGKKLNTAIKPNSRIQEEGKNSSIQELLLTGISWPGPKGEAERWCNEKITKFGERFLFLIWTTNSVPY